ncbi:unnamed protein product, partial [Choristocarpus tenellus]
GGGGGGGGVRVDAPPMVSVVMPVYNARAYLEEALRSVLTQTYRPLELSVYDDSSTDGSQELLEEWKARLVEAGVQVVITRPSEVASNRPLGIGCARNRAIRASQGEYLCHLDADDVMLPTRVEVQLEASRRRPGTLVGSRFTRTPEESTPYYTKWINGLSDERLLLEQYRECTIICPTWFYPRSCFEAIGGFMEDRNNPEDLTFFNSHLDIGGGLHKVEETLVVYRHVPGSFSGRTDKRVLQRARLPFLERRVLQGWSNFTIWGAGRDGRRFLNDLSEEIAQQVEAFCDVSAKLVGKSYWFRNRHIPIVHISQARPPFVICVGTKNFGGAVEANIASLSLVEGKDYYHFA